MMCPLQNLTLLIPWSEEATQLPSITASDGSSHLPIPSISEGSSASKIHQSTREENTIYSFVDLHAIDLMHSKRNKKITTIVKESQHTDPTNKSLSFLRPKAMMILALTAFTSSATNIIDSSVHCYRTREIQYDDFLEPNFDGSTNELNPQAEIYITTQSNNESYNLKEMMQQQDRRYFENIVHDEVSSMFRKDIWKQVPRRQMMVYYAKHRSEGLNINRE